MKLVCLNIVSFANAFAEEVVTNMRQAFRRRGRASTEIAWWHADRATGSFQRDTLDDALIQSTEGELILILMYSNRRTPIVLYKVFNYLINHHLLLINVIPNTLQSKGRIHVSRRS